jgi:hypothetical protein
LLGFAGEKVSPLGSIELPITTRTYPRQKVIMVKFLVVDRPSAYNAIFGRTPLNELKAVTSTSHLSMKFLTTEGVRVVKGDQREARRCYNLSLLMWSFVYQNISIIKLTTRNRTNPCRIRL